MASRTTRRTAYVVMAYWREGRGFRSGAQRLDSEAQACRRGREMSQLAHGVHVLELEVDESVDFCGEPRVLATYGEVPEVGT